GGDIIRLAQQAAHKLNTVIAITGVVDVIADTSNVYTLHNGHKLLTIVTGAGCLLTSVVGAFCAVEENPLFAAIAAISS
ncbi:hydroxyethylthiazole kinase, partial [Bacillus spizizenii]|uniref:hydroxyethylthiazole kinase n=1 Tax=Bacillus spizizenii TaxID=96241 RepID=UPI001F622B55